MDSSVSKTISYFLRHAPDEANLEMDKHGFVPVRQLCETLRKCGWEQLEKAELRSCLKSPDVERFQVAGERVRARYGHSIEINYGLPRAEIKSPLYHGTSRSAWDSIREEGLKPMGRNHVHLSRRPEQADRVGRRHDHNPVLIEINVPANEDPQWLDAGPVILADRVPPRWLSRLK